MAGVHVRFEKTLEEFLGDLTDAAYYAALRNKLCEGKSFLELRLAIQRALREAVRQDMFVTDVCGLYQVCKEAEQFEPWSREAIVAELSM